jgi:hypothetical protein
LSTHPAMADTRSSSVFAVSEVLRRVFTFPALEAAILMFGAALWARPGFKDTDAWWHLKVGEQILRTHTWPTADPFSFTVHGTPWIAYEWLGEVVIALSARLGGFVGEAALIMMLGATLVLLLFLYSYLRCKNSKAAFLACVLVMPAIAPFLTLRPQLMGYILLLLTLLCLDRFRSGSRRSIWFLPVLFLIWVNTHGTFIFGLGLIGLFWASGLIGFRKGGWIAERWTDSRRLQLTFVLLLCVLALPLTPYGGQLASYPIHMSLTQPLGIANIQEWQPLAFNNFLGKYFLCLILLFFAGNVYARPEYRVEDLGMLMFGAFAACVHVRFTILFMLFFAPILAQLLTRWAPAYDPRKDKWVLNAILIVGLASVAVFLVPSQEKSETSLGENFPVKALTFMQQHPISGPTFNDYGWGGYLIWRDGPDQKVFIDGRADIYEYGGVLRDYRAITWIESGALPALRKYGVNSCLIQRDSPLATLLSSVPDWERVYTDDVASIYARKVPLVGVGAEPIRSVLRD